MPSQSQLSTLSEHLSINAEILTSADSPEFQERLKRWSNVNLHVPAAIVIVKTEADCEWVIKWAASTGTPFACKSGGMSLYSTIGNEGIIVDLSDYSSVEVDKELGQAILLGGISSKAVAIDLAKYGLCTTLPSSNPVGAIPFFTNGGNSPLVSEIGYGSDNILGARMVTSSGEVITVSETENIDLLYAIRGAGQYFGLITSLTIRTYPVTDIFGNNEGKFWTGRFIYPLSRIQEVAETLQPIINDPTYNAGGIIMITAPPPKREPAVVVTAKLIHADSLTLQEKIFAPLYALNPLLAAGGRIPIENIGDALQPLMAPGDYKKLRLTGLQTYNPSLLPSIASIWQDFTAACPTQQLPSSA